MLGSSVPPSSLSPVWAFTDLPQGLAKFLSGQYGASGGLGLQNLGGNESTIIHIASNG